MFFDLGLLQFFLLIIACLAAKEENPHTSFIYNGFHSANLNLDGIAQFTSNGLLKLTNETNQIIGHAFFPNPITFRKNNNSHNGTAFSFSTTFVFCIRSEYPTLISGHGIAFVVAPTRGLPGALPSQYLGLFNKSNLGNDSNHVFAIELDTIQSSEFLDINDNHVGIDINDLKSVSSAPASYYHEGDGFTNLTLRSGQPMQVWVEYDGLEKQINVTLAPINIGKPRFPLLSYHHDLSSIVKDTMYVGFSSSTGSVLVSHYILGWSFKINGQAQELDLTQLPKLPRIGPKERSKLLTIGLPVICVASTLAVVSCAVCHV